MGVEISQEESCRVSLACLHLILHFTRALAPDDMKPLPQILGP
jgi:hypothetical protein